MEQLIAESLGKNYAGLIPVVGESPGASTVYSSDRCFIYLTLRGRERLYHRLISDLKEGGFRIKQIVLEDRYEVFGEAYRFMLATALTGYFIGVNPFDEPDVVLSKTKTRELLEKFKKEGDFGLELYVDSDTGLGFYYEKTLSVEYPKLSALFKKFFSDFAPWIYVGFLAYLPYDPEIEDIIRDIRTFVGKRKIVPLFLVMVRDIYIQQGNFLKVVLLLLVSLFLLAGGGLILRSFLKRDILFGISSLPRLMGTFAPLLKEKNLSF